MSLEPGEWWAFWLRSTVEDGIGGGKWKRHGRLFHSKDECREAMQAAGRQLSLFTGKPAYDKLVMAQGLRDDAIGKIDRGEYGN